MGCASPQGLYFSYDAKYGPCCSVGELSPSGEGSPLMGPRESPALSLGLHTGSYTLQKVQRYCSLSDTLPSAQRRSLDNNLFYCTNRALSRVAVGTPDRMRTHRHRYLCQPGYLLAPCVSIMLLAMAFVEHKCRSGPWFAGPRTASLGSRCQPLGTAPQAERPQASHAAALPRAPGQSDVTIPKEECTMIKNSYLTVPTNRTGSWGITVSLALRSSRPIVQMSTSSMRMVPPAGSTRRNKAIPSDDLPGDRKSQNKSNVSLCLHHSHVSDPGVHAVTGPVRVVVPTNSSPWGAVGSPHMLTLPSPPRLFAHGSSCGSRFTRMILL